MLICSENGWRLRVKILNLSIKYKHKKQKAMFVNLKTLKQVANYLTKKGYKLETDDDVYQVWVKKGVNSITLMKGKKGGYEYKIV